MLTIQPKCYKVLLSYNNGHYSVFIADLERAMDKIKERESGISVHGTKINNLRFADDVDLLEESITELEYSLKILNEETKNTGSLSI